eukprot:NODE_791_length_1340_cov_292.676995_g599_i0.p1 GENE.NODE_791_length_1340_cov_292.676995_g599_i0~~NODE_791_length_1340_cov_292.676995_g599_i0.p1  ORF type:complete len:361 (+),score=48.76 NODE_791_length_1340_cov_292.676995_g599_i0:94-1176(+)
MATRDSISRSRRIVVKIGSALLHSTSDAPFLKFSNQLSAVVESGRRVALVSSGAVSQGSTALGFDTKPAGMAVSQALASVGQPHLMHRWTRCIAPVSVAQFLLSRYDITNQTSFMSARRALRALHELDEDTLCIGNENDTVAAEGLKFGDNDNLAAQLAKVFGADLLIILTQVDGLYTANPEKDPSASIIHTVLPAELDKADGMADGAGANGQGVGGFETKLQAVRVAFEHKIPVVVANGAPRDILQRILQGEEVGTLFVPPNGQNWLHDFPVSGKVWLRVGALMGKNIHIEDIVKVEGQFRRGDCVEIHFADGITGRGLVGYKSKVLEQLKGQDEVAVLKALGPKGWDGAVLHTDDYTV